ncbi:hypothetical protein JNW98_34480, partial [Streptomyces sp. SCA2-4]|nr:hypothetical protein [Streptomyces huiliensis]
MTKRTRLRMARITAGAVIAAGASLTAAGAAAAAGVDVPLDGLKKGKSVSVPDGPGDGQTPPPGGTETTQPPT